LDVIIVGDMIVEGFAVFELFDYYCVVMVYKDEVDMFGDVFLNEKDLCKSLYVEEVLLFEFVLGEVFVVVMVLVINYNIVWMLIFELVLMFGFFEWYGCTLLIVKCYDLLYYVVGFDFVGVVLCTGVGVHSWKFGVEVVVYCFLVEFEYFDGYSDMMFDFE